MHVAKTAVAVVLMSPQLTLTSVSALREIPIYNEIIDTTRLKLTRKMQNWQLDVQVQTAFGLLVSGINARMSSE
jgi:hypothetical protein